MFLIELEKEAIEKTNWNGLHPNGDHPLYKMIVLSSNWKFRKNVYFRVKKWY